MFESSPTMFEDAVYPYEMFDIYPRTWTFTDHLNALRPTSELSESKKFRVLLNVRHFRPVEVSVKIVDNCVVVHGKHEEHADRHGFISREFTRRYELPDDVEPEEVTSSLTQMSGVLAIHAPRKKIDPPQNVRVVDVKLISPYDCFKKHKIQQASEQPKQDQPGQASKQEKQEIPVQRAPEQQKA